MTSDAETTSESVGDCSREAKEMGEVGVEASNDVEGAI